MPDAASHKELMGATREMLDRLSPDMRDLLRELLLHKSIFVAESFVTLATRGDADQDRQFQRVFDETVQEGIDAGRRLEEWNRLPHDPDALDALSRQVRTRLLEALIVLKELSTEAFLATAMAAPTSALRDDLVRLADIDRQHADDLRVIVGAPTVGEKLRAEDARDAGGTFGAHAGRIAGGTLGRSVQQTLQQLRASGVDPARLLLSAASLRHLRDEGHVVDNQAFGLPIDVDLGWGGETFAVVTRERVSLAEILTAQATSDAA